MKDNTEFFFVDIGGYQIATIIDYEWDVGGQRGFTCRSITCPEIQFTFIWSGHMGEYMLADDFDLLWLPPLPYSIIRKAKTAHFCHLLRAVGK